MNLTATKNLPIVMSSNASFSTAGGTTIINEGTNITDECPIINHDVRKEDILVEF